MQPIQRFPVNSVFWDRVVLYITSILHHAAIHCQVVFKTFCVPSPIFIIVVPGQQWCGGGTVYWISPSFVTSKIHTWVISHSLKGHFDKEIWNPVSLQCSPMPYDRWISLGWRSADSTDSGGVSLDMVEVLCYVLLHHSNSNLALLDPNFPLSVNQH